MSLDKQTLTISSLCSVRIGSGIKILDIQKGSEPVIIIFLDGTLALILKVCNVTTYEAPARISACKAYVN